MEKGLLAIFPHPDDETVAAGGLLALAAEEGLTATVLCLTYGERGQQRADACQAGNLADVRTAELEEACRLLGVERVVTMAFPDGQLASLDQESLTHTLVEAIEQNQPRVVVTFGSDGMYGHMDHRVCTRLVSLALVRASLRAPLRLLHAVFPKGLFRPVWRGLRRSGAAPIDPSLRPEMLGVDPAEVSWRLRLGPLGEKKKHAIGAYASQLKNGDPLSFLLPGLIEPLLQEEWYAVVHGPPLSPEARTPWGDL